MLRWPFLQHLQLPFRRSCTCSCPFSFFSTLLLPAPGSPYLVSPHQLPRFVVSPSPQARILQRCSQEIKTEPEKGKETCPRPHSKELGNELRSEAEVQARGKEGRCHSLYLLHCFVPSLFRQLNGGIIIHTAQPADHELDGPVTNWGEPCDHSTTKDIARA